MQRFHKLAFFNLLFLPIACLFVATTVHSFPQLLLPDDFPVAVAFDRSRLDESFDTSNTSPNSDDLSKTLYSSYIPPDFDDYLESSYSDDSAVPNVATSPEISNTAAIWFEKSDLVNLGTTLASSSLGDGDGRSDVPVQPDPSSTIDASSTDSEASEGNECVLSSAPVKRFYGGDDGGTGSGGAGRPVCVPKVPPQGATDSPTGGPNTSPPKNEPQVPPRGEDDPHEMQGPPDCTRFMGNLRVPFCCPPTSKDKVPGIANNPTRQANCYLCTSSLSLQIRFIMSYLRNLLIEPNWPFCPVDKTNPDCFDPRNRFCGYCLTGVS